ncbi:MAG: N-acetyltransferase [Cellulomonas sp.]|nr:N-acetyltransferase [Cellulomonas sp.]
MTNPPEPGLHVVEVPERSRFEVRAADGTMIGQADYEPTGGVLAFTHTEVDGAFEGRGVASFLVQQALDEVRGSGRTVVAICPYVRAWLHRHPDYQDLLAPPPHEAQPRPTPEPT